MLKRRLVKLGAVVALGATALAGACVPADDGGGDFTALWPMLIFIVFLFGLMYFLMIRPQRRRQREHQELMEELHKGDRVITAGGIHGQIESISEDSVVLRVESGASIRVVRSSVVGKQGESEPRAR